MLKHKGRERREEKRRENKRRRRSLCWSFGVFFSLDSLSRSCSSGRPKNAGRGEVTAKEGADPSVWTQVTARQSLGWEHRVQWESPPVNYGAGAQWEITGTACKENILETIYFI